MAEDNQPTEHDEEDAAPPNEGEQAVDFVSFVVGLATSALAHLGSPETGLEAGPAADLVLARQTIDILGMLEQKTKGNLTGDEERILGHVLYDLRMRYVEAVRRRG